jgi:hypothetical protein
VYIVCPAKHQPEEDLSMSSTTWSSAATRSSSRAIRKSVDQSEMAVDAVGDRFIPIGATLHPDVATGP